MSPAGRLALAAAGAAAVVILFFVLRPGNEQAAQTTTGTASIPTTATSSVASIPATTTQPAAPRPVRITFEGGEVTGPRRPEFTVGDRVVLIVRSDVAEEVHVHGYDLMADVAPGVPARISFKADAEGRFEVELEGRHLPLTELVVEP